MKRGYVLVIIRAASIGATVIYFNTGFESALNKERLKLSSEVSALSGELFELNEAISGVSYQLKVKQQKLATLNTLDDSKPIVEDKPAPPEVVKDETKGYGKCITNEDEPVSYEGVSRNYADYIEERGCEHIFAGAEVCYWNKKETCLLFPNMARYEERLSN